MRSFSLLAAVSVFLPLAGFAKPVDLFDGKSLTGWKVSGGDCWKAGEGTLTGESNEKKEGSILWTEASYKNFTVELEFRFSGEIDSGVFLREENEQIQIGVSRSLKKDMTGSPYIASQKGYPAEAKGVKEALKQGEWNKLKIIVSDKNYRVFLNDAEVLNYDSAPKALSGPVGLQVHPGVQMKIEFRHLTLDPAE